MSEQPNSKTSPSELQEAAANAQILLGYISSCGKIEDSNKGIVDAVILRKDEIENITKEDESKFWIAFSKLSKIAQPATLESIISLENSQHQVNKKSIALSTVRRYRAYGLIAIILLLFFQMYWLVGIGLLSDVQSLPGKIEDITSQKEERVRALGNGAGDDLKITFLEAKIENLNDDLEVSSEALKEWNIAYSIYQSIKDIVRKKNLDTTQVKLGGISKAAAADASQMSEDGKLQFALKYSPYVLDVIQLYFLPLLYGVLGGIAFILRNLSREIREQSFTQQSRASYLLRIFLGALAGLAIGWFLGDSNSKTNLGIGSLSPLALAFLAGYSVEVLFALMDKIIEMISKASPAPQQVTTKAQ